MKTTKTCSAVLIAFKEQKGVMISRLDDREGRVQKNIVFVWPLSIYCLSLVLLSRQIIHQKRKNNY